MPDDKQLPIEDNDDMVAGALALRPDADLAQMFSKGPVSPALAIMLNERLFNQVKRIAQYMAAARGVTPPHLIGCEEACFAVALNSIVWKLNPYMVAASTYQTPGGRIGYEGKLVQAIIENSGKVRGRVRFTHYGPWEKIQQRFKMARSAKGNEYPVPAWEPKDEPGVGVNVQCDVISEAEPRTFNFDLVQAYPRNSTLWATDPKTQICYTAVRRFANTALPGLMMGVPEWSDEHQMRDITPPAGSMMPRELEPEPTRASTRNASRAAPAKPAPTVTDVEEETEQQQEQEQEQEQEQTGSDAGPGKQEEAKPAGDVTYELYDEVGEMVVAFSSPQDLLRAFLERAHKTTAPRDRAQFLDNNKATIRATVGVAGDHPLAAQAIEYYQPPAPKQQAAAIPMVPIPATAEGKPDLAAWQKAIGEAQAHIADAKTFEKFAALTLEQAIKAGVASGPLNSIKLLLARRRGELEKARDANS